MTSIIVRTILTAAPSVIYAKAFFDLQLRFAERVAAVSGRPLERALFEYTNLYVRFGLGRDYDADHPTWREYVAGVRNAGDTREWTYRFYLARAQAGADGAPPVVASVGCFSYARSSEDRIRLHFLNGETDGRSPIAADRRDQRVAELAALFAHVKQTQPLPLQVLGTSWLYNLEAYRRLFPPPYVASARPIPPRFRNMPLWGQFLDRRGEVRESRARTFLESVERAMTLDGLSQCFPFQVFALDAPVEDFFAFYAI